MWQKAVAVDFLFYMGVQKTSVVEKLQHYSPVVTEADAQVTHACQILKCLPWLCSQNILHALRGLLCCFFSHLKLKCEFSSESFGLKAAEGIADDCLKNALPGCLSR